MGKLKASSSPFAFTMGGKDGCALFCMITAALGCPMLLWFGYMNFTGSQMMAVPDDQKVAAGKGCFQAAFLYGVTFVVCFFYVNRNKDAEAREKIQTPLIQTEGGMKNSL